MENNNPGTITPKESMTPDLPKEHQNRRWIFGGLFGVVLLIAGFWIINTREKIPWQSPTSSQKEEKSLDDNISPTPMPFEELTIPALRSRTYKSTLAERELYAENTLYTSYLTSYTSDGVRVNGLITEPVGDMPSGGWPAIVFVHGYIPPAQYQTTGQYADYVDYLARNGFVVFKIDLRGHGDSEGVAGGGYYSADYVIDTLNAHAALQTTSFVNPEKIGLWGHSMAGNVILRSLAIRPNIPAAVIWAGAVYTYEDMQKYGIQDSSYQRPPTGTPRASTRQRISDTYGEPDLDTVFWKQFAPITYIADLKGALQLNHAVDDDVVNIGYSRDLNTALDRTSVPHEIHEYSSGGHNISGTSFVEAMNNTVDFFEKYLQ